MARTFVAASSQYLEAQSAVLTAAPVTLACWARPAGTGTYEFLTLDRSDVASTWFILGTEGTGKFRAGSGDGTNFYLPVSNGPYTPGVWAHVAFVVTSPTVQALAVNGVVQTFTGPVPTAVVPTGLNRTEIGRLCNGSGTSGLQYTDGDIAEAAIWNVALTAADLAALALGLSPLLVRPDALVFYAPLNGGTPEPDIVGRRNLTVTGATVVPHPALFAIGGLSVAALPSVVPGAAATASFGLSTTTALSLPAPLAASAALRIGTNVTFAAAALASTSTMMLSAAAALLAPVRFAATATITISTVPAFAVVRFTAAPKFTIGATATLTTKTEKAHASTATILLAGIEARARVAGLTIRDVLNDAPNSCTLTIDGTETPECEQTLRVLLDLDAPKLLFNGALQSVNLSYEGRPNQLAYPCNAIDDTGRANRMRPFGTWTNVSATTVAQQLITQFAPGLTTVHVQANLPPVSIVLDGTEGMSGALKQVTTQIGGYYYFEDGDLHLFLEETTAAPDPIDMTPGRLLDTPPITISRDDSQLRTRQYGRGHGEALIADVLAGENILPVENAAAWFGTVAAGGRAIVGGQRLRYTGLQTAPGGSLVGPGAGPSVAPNVLGVGGAGLPTGVLKYAFSFVTAAGESLTGPPATLTTGPVVGTPMANPTAAPSATPVAGAGMSQGTRQYAVTYLNAAGETLPGPPVSATTTPVAAPTTAMRWLAGTVIGSLPGDGGHAPFVCWSWAVTFVVPSGETLYGPRMDIGNGLTSSVGFPCTDVPIGPPGTTARHILRTVAQYGNTPTDAHNAALAAPLYSEGTINDNTTILYTCGMVPDNQLGNVTMGTAVNGVNVVTNIPTGPSGTVARRLYRTQAGQSQLLLVATINDNSTTAYSDSTSDGNLGPAPPGTNTTGLVTNVNAASISGVATGPGGTTARRLYRTGVNGTQLKLLATINDNSTTSYGQDVAADATLGVNAPTSDTSGLGGSVIAGTVLAGSPTLPTSGTAPFNKTSALTPPAAPVLTPVTGSGVDVGVHSWAATFVTSSGETLPGPVATRSIGPLDPPPQPTVGTPSGNGGVAPGTYDYCVAFTTVNGETVPGPISAPVTVTPVGVAVPAIPAIVSNGPNSTQTSRAIGHTIGYRMTYVTAQGETLPSNIAYTTTVQCTQATYNSSAITVKIFSSPDPRVTSMNMYTNIDGGPFYRTYSNINNVTGNYADIGPDILSGPQPPTVDATLLNPGFIPITLPVGASPATGRKLYRRTGGGLFYLVGTWGDLTTTAYVDSTPSANLGPPALSVSTAGTFGQMALSGISIGGSGVTARRIYRTTLAGQLKFAGQLLDNISTTFTDGTPDSGLGPNAPTSDTSGGGVVIGGWAVIGSQAIRYTGITGNTLTGIPPSGPGALATTVVYGAQILPAPALTGVTGLTLPTPKGTPVCIFVQRDDLAAQAEQKAVDVETGIVPADGIYEGPILVDERRNEASMNALCDANLALYSRPIVTVNYDCRDTKTKSGKTVRIDLDSPAIHETLTIQEVTITEIDIAPGLLPRFSVVASSTRFSLDDILRRLLVSTDAT